MTSSVRVGAAVVDVTPQPGLAMSGYLARTSPATGTHDPITVRALAVDNTVLVTVDVCGLHEDSCTRIRSAVAAAGTPVGTVLVAATHTHGGPAVVPGRLGGPVDPAYLAELEQACVDAVRAASRARRPAQVWYGVGADPGVARNRRRPDGPTDPALPVVRFVDGDGDVVAVLVAYACHPVVLSADNTLWTADYPGVVRAELERAHPGAAAFFLTSCCGDANTGHPARASMAPSASDRRTFAACAEAGQRIAAAALAASMEPVAGRGGVSEVRQGEVCVDLSDGQGTWPALVSVLDWSGVRLVALPGEQFAATGLALRAAIPGPLVIAGYTDGCPGYFPTEPEYTHGGYEVEDAHRYYGMPTAFAPGSAERLRDEALRLIRAT